jgi:hypothetical protein
MKGFVRMLALAAAVIVLPNLVNASNGPTVLGNQDISIEKDAAGNIRLVPAGPYIVEEGETVKLTNNVAGQTILVVYRNVAGAAIQSTNLAPGGTVQRTQAAFGNVNDIASIEVDGPTKAGGGNFPPGEFVKYGLYAHGAGVPGIGAPGLLALALLLTGAGIFAVRMRKQTAA